MDYQNNPEEKKKYQGDWKCSNCGNKITQLPFEPDPNRLNRLLCLDCWKNQKQARR